MAKLMIRKPGSIESKFNISSPVVTIGRAKENSLVIAGDTKVSRRHTRLDYLDGSFYVSDLNSSNGTYVNERIIKGRTALKDGDKLGIGDTDLIFFSEGGIITGAKHEAHEIEELDPKSLKPLGEKDASKAPIAEARNSSVPQTAQPKPVAQPRPKLELPKADVSTTKCPKCSAVIDVTNIPKGSKVGCARCKHIFVV